MQRHTTQPTSVKRSVSPRFNFIFHLIGQINNLFFFISKKLHLRLTQTQKFSVYTDFYALCRANISICKIFYTFWIHEVVLFSINSELMCHHTTCYKCTDAHSKSVLTFTIIKFKSLAVL